MPDPLSITTGVVTLIGACWTVSIQLKQFRDGVGGVNAAVSGLLHDVEDLRQVLESMRETFDQAQDRSSFTDTGHVGNHWRNLSQSLQDGQAALVQLLQLLEGVNKNTTVLDAPRKYLRFKSATEQIARFRDRIQSYRDTLQLSLQTVILWNQVTLRESTERLLPNLDGLQKDIRRIASDLSTKIDHLQSMVVDRDSLDDVGAMRNLRNCVQTAATIISSASTIMTSERDDQLSIIQGSDFGDCFPSEPSEMMRRWISSKTVYGYEVQGFGSEPSNPSPLGIQVTGNPDNSIAVHDSDSDSDLEIDMINALFKSAKTALSGRDYDLAERQLRNCLSRLSVFTPRGRQRVNASNCVSRTEVMTQLFQFYFQQERWEEATSVLKDKLSDERRYLGKGDQKVLSDMTVLADVLLRKGDRVEAQLYARQALRGYRRFGANGTDGVAKTLALLVKICHADGKDDEGDAYAAMLSNFMEEQPSLNEHDKLPEAQRKEKTLPAVTTSISPEYLWNLMSGARQAPQFSMRQQEVERPKGIILGESRQGEWKLERDREKEEENKMIRYLQRNIFDQPSHARSQKKSVLVPTDPATSASVSQPKPTNPSISSTLDHPSAQISHDSEHLAYLAKMNKHPVTTEEAEEVKTKVGAHQYFECSAKTNEGVSELFEYAAVLEAPSTNRRGLRRLFGR